MRLELRQGCKVDVDLVSIGVGGFVTDTYFGGNITYLANNLRLIYS